ncbi:MAG: aminotransferase class IV [Micrococcales bacterium]|nr:aminotransferase class IV [Micrococcales bacterium]
MANAVWVNGRLVEAGDPAVPALDHGVIVGDGAFETAKIVDGQVFASTRHMDRMDHTLKGLGLSALDRARLQEGVEAVLAAGEPIAFGRLRYTVTGGVGPLGSDRLDSDPTYVVAAGPQQPFPDSVAITTVPWTRNERAATAGLKTTSYADNVIALSYAHEHGASEAIFANTRGELCEGTGSNIFVVVDGVLLTPPADSGLLLGITRALTIEWCREEGLEVREQALPMDILATCDEVFITSTTRDVLPVHAVDGREIAAPGPVSARAREIFTRLGAERLDP